MTQADFVFDAPPRVRKSRTSINAGEAIAPKANKLREMVLELLRNGYGLTDEEMQSALAMNPSTQRPRRIELVAAGLVRDSGETRKTASGRQAVVWRAV